ncbi:MAG: heavy metal translocating P-type ATPase [Bradymonadaceae bacterium]
MASENHCSSHAGHTHDQSHGCDGDAAIKLPPPTPAAETTRSIFDVEGLCCQSEARLIEDKLAGVAGIHHITVNIPAGTVSAYYLPELVNPTRIAESLTSIGMRARERRSLARARPTRGALSSPRFRTMAVGAVFVLLAALTHYLLELPTVAIGLFIAAILVGGVFVFRSAFIAARHKQFDISVLVTIAVVGAAAIGEWFEASTVIVLFAFAEWLEDVSMGRARQAITDLMELAPPVAIVRRGGHEVEVDVENVIVGDIVVVKPGSKIAVDGIIIAGKTDIDESPITGESVPVIKTVGATVYAGTMGGRGSIDVRTIHLASKSTLAHIIDAIEEARENQSTTERFIDRFARIYTPAVVGLAALVALIPPLFLGALWGEWFYRALVFLVIACPCALVISTPIATVAGLARAARQGILIKGGRYLEMLGKLQVIAFDKTGTLTTGRPTVTRVVAVDGVDETEVLDAAAFAEMRSEHHLGRAIIEEAHSRGIATDASRIVEFSAELGEGVDARRQAADGSEETLLVGTMSLLSRHHVELSDWLPSWQALEEKGQTVVGVARDNRFLGLIAIADIPRPHATEALERLRELGIKEIHLLTGDNPSSAGAVAAETGILANRVHAGLLPAHKVDKVRALTRTHGYVAMIGDGINDAPALAAASVGVAMGAAGTDVALESADVALMADDLSRLSDAINTGRRTLSIIKQNVVVAIGLKLIFLVLAAAGIATLWMAIIADMGASLLVIFNAMRLLRKTPEKTGDTKKKTPMSLSHG